MDSKCVIVKGQELVGCALRCIESVKTKLSNGVLQKNVLGAKNEDLEVNARNQGS